MKTATNQTLPSLIASNSASYSNKSNSILFEQNANQQKLRFLPVFTTKTRIN